MPVRPGALARPAAILSVAVAVLLRWRRLRGRDRILKDLREPFLLKGSEHHATASIGIAPSTPAEEDPRPILRRADEAMYLAKERGRARYALHEG